MLNNIKSLEPNILLSPRLSPVNLDKTRFILEIFGYEVWNDQFIPSDSVKLSNFLQEF